MNQQEIRSWGGPCREPVTRRGRFLVSVCPKDIADGSVSRVSIGHCVVYTPVPKDPAAAACGGSLVCPLRP